MIWQWRHWATALNLDRLARGWLGGHGVVVMLHRVQADLSAWRGSPHLWVTLQQLRAIITTLREEGYEWVSISEALARRGGRHRSRFACLTFDDGYRDNYDLAFPLLYDLGVPATIYITTGFIEGTQVAWQCGLEDLIERYPQIDLEIEGRRECLPAVDLTQKHFAYYQTCAWLNATTPAVREQALQDLEQKYGFNFSQASLEQMLTESMLHRLASSGQIELGAHTVSHPMLSTLPINVAKAEMVDSKQRLEVLSGQLVQHFAYPFGKHDSVNPEVLALAPMCGFASAVLAYGGPVYPHSNPYALPRLPFGGSDTMVSLRLRASGVPALLARAGIYRPNLANP
jgi:peptidoglycan/xylan/chitin deacetylase (PgdA/CDA1 family)